MAIHPTAENLQNVHTDSSSTSLTQIIRAVLAPLASLKLTVFLLALSVFVIWVITLEQATIDIWELKNKHFSSPVVYVPLQTFLPPKWFPNAPQLGMNMLLPSGFSLIVAMLINLTTAHLLRFRIQASGMRLYVGIGVLIASAALTWAIIFNGQDASGFQGQPPIPWERMWTFLQIAVLALAVGAVFGAYNVGRERMVERIAYGFIAVTLMAALAVSMYKGEDAFIGDSAMRILWQLTQSTVAAMAVLAGCLMLFKRKAGIVLLHLGIAGILLNEIYVTVTNEEYRISFAEGETVHHAVDLRETEFVVIDRSDKDYDKMTVLPGSMLTGLDEIDDPRLPFKIRCLEYFENSDVLRVGPHAENKANKGLGLSFVATPLKPVAGADVDAGADQASGYVELVDRENEEPIGTFLVSQAAYDQGILDTVSIDGDDYQIGLRFKTVYKPYSLKLKDTSAEYYVGTQIPSWFSSDFEIADSENGITSDQKIWMNNPLRYRDETFYQVRYSEDQDKKQYSGIQIVKNKGWMIPYVCCMFVVVGLIAQFQQTLTSFLTKSNRKQTDSDLPADDKPGRLAMWAPTILLLGVFGFYYGSQFARSVSPKLTKAKGSEIRLDLLGRVPVTFGGRVQPLDTYARSLARQLSNREFVKDGYGNKQPAIRWLADMMFGVSGCEEYEILRIEDTNVQNALGLPRRKGLKYKFSEIRAANKKLIELMIESDKLPVEEITVFHERLREVYSKSRMLMGTQTAFYGTDGRVAEDDLLGRLEVAANLANTKSSMPFAVPTDDPQNPWMPLSVALEQQWIAEIADKSNQTTLSGLAKHLLDSEIAALKPELVKEKIISDLMRYEEIVEGLSEKFKLTDPGELAEVLSNNWHLIPEHLYADEVKDAEKFIDFQLVRWRTGKDKLVVEMLSDLNGVGSEAIQNPDSRLTENLLGLKKAYVDGDSATFNSLLEKHIAVTKQESPKDLSSTAMNWEIAYNYFSPFHVASFLYLLGFLVTIVSWIGLRVPMNRAAFWLICFALLVHLGGVVARIVISGRPPITNLYSSFVVVAACSVVILLIIEMATRLGIGNLLAGACGFLALLYAWTLSIDQGDTFTVLRAVLDTQFWLTTHVIIINMGYSATIAAGLVGVMYLLGSMFSKRFNKPTRKMFASIIYGTVCFALLFSFFGTVLGGLWADDSWGRFWGWDPKENGALMIVLWNAMILHARWAGIIRERGLAALAALGNVITIWSWEGVNQLGVGLHAYGGVASGSGSGSLLMEPMFWLLMTVVVHIFIAIGAMIVPLSWYRSSSESVKTAS